MFGTRVKLSSPFLLPLGLACALAGSFVLAVWRSKTRSDAEVGAAANAMSDIFASDLVVEAPSPQLPRFGTHNFSDPRGEYIRAGFQTSSDEQLMYTNLVYTSKRRYRSGDIHHCDQVNTMIAGEAIVTTLTAEGTEAKRYLLTGETLIIPSGVPHLFYFRKDSLMTEYWTHERNGSMCEFRAWFYKPFRDRVERDVNAARAAAAHTS